MKNNGYDSKNTHEKYFELIWSLAISVFKIDPT